MNKLQQGFTLIELMIVVAIIGILAAVAIPSYQDYTARAQVTEAMSLTSSFKTGLAEYYSDSGAWPAKLTAIGTTTAGKYVNDIALASAGATVTMTATMKATGVNASIANGTFIMGSTDGALNWTCNGGTIASKYRPGACK